MECQLCIRLNSVISDIELSAGSRSAEVTKMLLGYCYHDYIFVTRRGKVKKDPQPKRCYKRETKVEKRKRSRELTHFVAPEERLEAYRLFFF